MKFMIDFMPFNKSYVPQRDMFEFFPFHFSFFSGHIYITHTHIHKYSIGII